MHRSSIPLFILALALSATGLSLGTPVQHPSSPFGVICSWSGIRDAGIKWVRCGAGCSALDWGAIERERSVFFWNDADSEVDNCRKIERADLLPILGYTPKWASSGPHGENNYPPKDLKDWSHFVYQIVRRYRDRIKCWEVWNEEDIDFWHGTPEQYSDLLKTAYIAAKRADPDCTIVLGGTAGVNLPFVERLYQLGAGSYFDVMAVHPYQWGDTFDDQWFCSQLRDLHSIMEKWGDGHKEIWLTEFGWSTGDKAISEDIQARLFAQGFVTALTLRDANVTRAFWFCVKDWGGPGYGLYRPDGTRKPAFTAYATVTRALEGAVFARSQSQSNLRVHVFRKPTGRILVAWSAVKEKQDLFLPAEGRWTRIYRIDGTSQRITDSSLPIEIGPEPVFVSGGASLPSLDTAVRRVPANPYRHDVWLSVHPQDGTGRLYIERGKHVSIPVAVHNDSSESVRVRVRGSIGSGHCSSVVTPLLAPGGTTMVRLPFMLDDILTGANELHITGFCNGKSLQPMKVPVRVSDGPVIEFMANSTVESRYLVENNGSGCAPGVRFNGSWTYRFDLSRAESARLRLNVGAHQANEWRVLLSSDGSAWRVALAGRSTRNWHEIDLTPFAGGPLFVKFEGNDQQLSELILTTESL